MRTFNTAGPIKKDKHYYVEPLKRWDHSEIMSLIDNEKYFLLHTPRQSGKTSYLFALYENKSITDLITSSYALCVGFNRD